MRLIALVALAACTPGVPEAPSFQQDVMPILAANCVRCHGSPALGGAPVDLRLDSFSDVPAATGPVAGAATYALAIDLRIHDGARPMPPRFPLEDYQLETLARWAAAPERGVPRPGNHLPEVAIEGTIRTATGVVLNVRVFDRDGDLVAGTIYAGTEIVGPVRSGVIDLPWTTAPGSYALVARLDDGADLHAIELGSVVVEAP